MRIQQEAIEEKIAALLVSLGLSEDMAELTIPYFTDTEKKELPKELIEKLPNLNLSKLSQQQKEKCTEVQKEIKNEILQWKLINVLYQIGGATAYYPLKYRSVSYSYTTDFNLIKELLKLNISREQLLNISAEQYVFSTGSYNWDLICRWIGETKVLPEEIPGLLENCSVDASNGKIFLLNIYFYLKEQEEGYIPAKQDPELFKKFEDLISRNMETIFNITFTPEENEAFYNYLQDDTNQSVPSILQTALKSKSINNYLIKLLVGGAFLHHKFSTLLKNFVRMAIELRYEAIFTQAKLITAVPISYWKEYEMDFDENFPIPSSYYYYWLATQNDYNLLKKKAQQNESKFLNAIEKVIKKYSVEIATRMIMIAKEQNGSLDEKLETLMIQMQQKVKDKLHDVIYNGRQNNKDLIKNYLEGIEPLSSLLAKEDEIQNDGQWTAYYQWDESCRSYVRTFGEDEFYERLLIYITVASKKFSCYGYLVQRIRDDSNHNFPFFNKLYQIYIKNGLSISYLIKIAESCDHFYDTSFVEKLKVEMENILSEYAKAHKEELIGMIKTCIPMGRIIILKALLKVDQSNISILYDYFSDTSKQVKEVLVTILKDRKEEKERIVQKLSSKKAAERETAMIILCENKTDPEYKEILENALKTEKSEKLASYLRNQLHIAEIKEEGEEILAEETVEGYVKELLKGNRKRSLAWLYETPMPVVHNTKKEEISTEYMQAVLLSYSLLNPAGINQKTNLLTEVLEKKELEEFAQTLFDRWLNKGAESKKKWVLYFVSVYGGTPIVERLKYQITEWPKQARGAIAVDAVKALACNGGSVALMTVDNISRKFKYRQIKEAAKTALTLAAKELGVSVEELSDRIVPDLGFGQDGSRTFSYGSRSFQVMITPALELEVFDEKNKKLKTLPSPGAKDDKEQSKQAYQEFKEMKKLLKTTIASQESRLEFALSTERKWSVKAWKALFVENPIMHQFAMGLIWGMYQEGEIQETFRYMEDGTFNTVEEDEYELPESGKIGLIHPLEVSKELIEAWREQLTDYEITQPIIQLERNIYEVEPQEEENKELERFGGYVINHLSFAEKLMANGWSRGSILDGGGYYTFYKEEPEQDVAVELEFSGAWVGGDNEDITIYEIRFYRPGTVKYGSYIYDTIKPEDAYALKDVPKRFFSETVYQLTKLLSTSSRKDPDWRKKDRYY